MLATHELLCVQYEFRALVVEFSVGNVLDNLCRLVLQIVTSTLEALAKDLIQMHALTHLDLQASHTVLDVRVKNLQALLVEILRRLVQPRISMRTNHELFSSLLVLFFGNFFCRPMFLHGSFLFLLEVISQILLHVRVDCLILGRACIGLRRASHVRSS